MSEEVKNTEDSVLDTSEADAQAVQNEILGKTSSEPAKETPREPEKKVEEEGKPAAEEKVEAKPKEEALTPDAEEETKIAEILSRFKGDPNAVKRQIAKAYREKEKQFSERDGEIGDLRKEVLKFRQFQEDLEANPEGTIKWLQETTQKKKEESSESLMDRALEDSTVLPEYIDQEIAKREDQKNWVEQEEVRMENLHAGWKDRVAQRNALRQAIQLNKFPYPDEILDFAVRGAGDPEKLLADAKVAVEKDRNEALAGKMDEQVQAQAGGGREKIPSSDSRIVGDSILTEEEKARR